MLPLDLSQVVGIGYNEIEGLVEMESRYKHNWILILFNVSRKHEGRELKCIICHYKPFKLLYATSSPTVYTWVYVYPLWFSLYHAIRYQCIFLIYIQEFLLVSMTIDTNDTRKRNLKVI